MDQARITHPDREQLAAFLHGRLDDAERRRVEKHIAECDSCCDVLRNVPPDDLVAGIQTSDTPPNLGETEFNGPVHSQTLADTSDGEIPDELNQHPRYRIIQQLGAGGMGVVYQAEHRLMERPVALKVIRARLVDSDVAVERFRLEVKAAARLSHRNIVTAYDAEQAGDLHFLVMEYIDGISLSELVHKKGKLSVLHACNYAMQAALGLQHALEQGMVHRDIKPHNLMRTDKGTIKILDFGLARFAQQQSPTDETGITGENATLGTPDYIAPEQARDSRRADIRADIYSLGCTLYYLLTGGPPFPKGSAMEKVVAHVEREPTPLARVRQDIPDEVIRIVDRMMAKDPDQRFQRPADVAEALKVYAKPGDSGPPSNAEPEPQRQEPEKATQDTYADAGPTLPPLDQLDLSSLPPPSLVAKPQRRQRSAATGWLRWLNKHRVWLVGMAAGLALMAGVYVSLPALRAYVASFAGNQPERLEETPDAGEWTDLIAALDPQQGRVAGNWRREGDALVVDSTPSARIVLPYRPPREYDFEVEFTRHSGQDSIALHFVSGRGQATFEIDAWGQHLAGIQMIDGLSCQENATRVDNRPLVNGQTYTATVRVREARVEVYLDGERLAVYEGDGSNLSPLELWQLTEPDALGLGAYQSSTTFHRAQVRPH